MATIVLFASTITHNAIIILIWNGVLSPLTHIIFDINHNSQNETKSRIKISIPMAVNTSTNSLTEEKTAKFILYN